MLIWCLLSLFVRRSVLPLPSDSRDVRVDERNMDVGFWGNPTATIDFCEPNYEHSKYVAEFWNTLSSIPIFLVGAMGVWLCHVQALGPEQMLCYAMVAVVGLGSAAFHATLLREGQILDECPMLWVVQVLIYTAYHHRSDRRQRCLAADRKEVRCSSRRQLVLLRTALILYAITATGVYFASGFLFFVLAYAVSVAALVFLAAGILLSEQPRVGAQPRRLLTTAACTYVGGFGLLWIPGEVLCHRLPIMQRLPMHALFHLTSAAAPHLGLTAFALARFEVDAFAMHAGRVTDEPHASDSRPPLCARPSLMFAGLPTIDRQPWQLVRKAV